uniref:Uncharacterized protein LOC104237764 n=1 Tax=Nicotiana sylvestris TaxID=4096 RepID=A0A1U7XUX3_NICSY|nr:PREDICTED: uncharacterized protein LOC104237764 [Nicotiana sylvestris]
MAHGVKFSLAVPVLASIYRGLREISTSNDLIASDVIFPIHYVYGWMGEYFETHHRVNHTHRSLPLCKISGEKMAKYFNLSDARRLFQRDDARQLHHLALLRGKELHFTDNGKLSDSFSEFFISLRSSYLTLRHDATFIVESYSPYRFSRQFGFFQDIPGDLMEQPYDGTLQALVQLWDSSTRLGTSSKFIVPVRPVNDMPLMTREYIDWWPIHRLDPSKKIPHIVSTSPRQDQVHVRSKGVPSRLKVKLTSPFSKPKTKSNDLPQATQTLSTSKVVKDVDAHVKKKVRRLSLALKTTTTTPKVSSDSCKRKEHLVSSNQGSDREPSLVPLCEEKNHLPILSNGIGDITTASSPVESESSEDHHWNRPNKKAKELGDDCCGTAVLDTIIIEDDAFVDEDTGLTMPFPELPEQSDLQELCNDELGGDIIEDCFADIDDLGMTAKSSHKSPNGSKDYGMGGASSMELIPPRKPYSSSPVHRKFIQPAVMSEAAAATTEIMHPKLFRPSSWPLQPGASSKEPHETICHAKSTFVSVMWRGLCEWIKEFSVDSTDSFMKLEESISLTLTEIRRENIIDISTLEDLVEAFFKTYAEYDALRSSKMSK